jgi:hypothetical protein
MPSIVKTLRVCSANLHMTVHLVLPIFVVIDDAGKFRSFQFLTAEIVLSLVFRDKGFIDMALTHGQQTRAIYDTRCAEVLGKYRTEVETLRDRAQNLKFVTQRCDWDEDMFCTTVINS